MVSKASVHAQRRRWLGTAAGVLAALLFLGGLAWTIYKLASAGGGATKPAPQQVAILRQPPPPPPKPPEKPPEPPKIKEEVKVEQPKLEEPKPVENQPDDPKPASDRPLGVDADGAAGSDGFGLAATRGGRDLLSTGSGGGGAGRYYTGLLQRNFFEALARNRKAPQSEFSVVVSILLGDDGRVERADIITSSGNAEIDTLIQSTLAEMPALREVPPSNLRRVQLRLNRRA